jgi:hypothetical protein
VSGRLLREPLVHFVVLGALIFGAAEWRATDRGDDVVIMLGPEELAGLHADHERRTGQPPTPHDEQALIDRFVEDEMLYREALALGLDRGDVIVRRRLLQKMEFLLDARADLEPPTAEDLRALRDARPDRYRAPARIDLQHVFVDAARHGDRMPRVATGIAAALASGADPARQGDPFLRGRELRAQSRQDLSEIFGPAFAAAVETLPVGTWSAPVESSYGLHLVRILDRTPAYLPDVGEIEPALRLDWLEARRAEARREALRELRQRYAVRVSRGASEP